MAKFRRKGLLPGPTGLTPVRHEFQKTIPHLGIPRYPPEFTAAERGIDEFLDRCDTALPQTKSRESAVAGCLKTGDGSAHKGECRSSSRLDFGDRQAPGPSADAHEAKKRRKGRKAVFPYLMMGHSRGAPLPIRTRRPGPLEVDTGAAVAEIDRHRGR